MRRFVCLAAALALLLTGVTRADEQAEMKKVIDKAIKAAGGAEKLAKFQAETFKGKGKFYGMGDGIDYTGEWAVQQPDKLRVKIEGGAGDMKFTFVRVINGDKIWMKFGDNTQEVDDKDQIAEAKEAMYVTSVTSLVPLQDKSFTLASLGEVKIDGKPAVGVRVSHKGRRDVSLFFDKNKDLLVKSESVVKDAMAGGQEVTQETLYSDYKEVHGVQRPMNLVINRDGKKYVETEITELEPQEKLDDSMFGKP